MLETHGHSKRVTCYLEHINKIIMKPSHFLFISHYNARVKNDPGHALHSGISAAALLPLARPGHRSVITVLCLLREVFFWMLCLPLALWFWHWSTVVCKRQYIRAPGFAQLPALLLELHSWEVSEFPGRWSLSSICSSLVAFRRPRALFCSSGFQEWVWGMRIPNQGNYHYMSKMGAIRPSSHIFFFFCKEWLLSFLKLGPCLQKPNRN